MKNRKLVAALACRNGSSRLYAKPLQSLSGNKEITILNTIIDLLKKKKEISEICLGISNKKENIIYKEISRKLNVKFILGDDKDVLSRLIKCAKKTSATDIFRITTECPYIDTRFLSKLWKKHLSNNYDATFYTDLMDGLGFEIIRLDALIDSHKYGKSKHRSELCSLYIRENLNKFNVYNHLSDINDSMKYRLTVDYPEDLIIARKVYKEFSKYYPEFPVKKIIKFLKKNKNLIELMKNE